MAKWPRNRPALRDEMKRLGDQTHHMTKAEIDQRLEVLTGCLTEIIVEAARPE